MFSVIFEVLPNKENWDDYLDNAKMLRPELEKVEGFVDNVRYKSLTRDGWILSLSNWRDEKSLVRWRRTMRHHEVQQKGRDEILADYHLRVGQVTADNQLPSGLRARGAAARRDRGRRGDRDYAHQRCASCRLEGDERSWRLGQAARHAGLGGGERVLGFVDAALTSGDLIFQISWKDDSAARAYESAPRAKGQGEGPASSYCPRLRQV